LEERSELVAPWIDEQVDEHDSALWMDADRQAIGEVPDCRASPCPMTR
jgi:hypothetical protein